MQRSLDNILRAIDEVISGIRANGSAENNEMRARSALALAQSYKALKEADSDDKKEDYYRKR